MAEASTYKKPGWFTTNVSNRVVSGLARLGVGLAGARTLTVRGRKSGKPYTTPVNPLDHGGETYLVAPRGNTQWARNLRVVEEGELRIGRKSRRFRGEEVPDSEKLPILKAYLDKWAWEVGMFFELPKDPSDEQITAITADHPVFRVRYQ